MRDDRWRGRGREVGDEARRLPAADLQGGVAVLERDHEQVPVAAGVRPPGSGNEQFVEIASCGFVRMCATPSTAFGWCGCDATGSRVGCFGASRAR